MFDALARLATAPTNVANIPDQIFGEKNMLFCDVLIAAFLSVLVVILYNFKTAVFRSVPAKWLAKCTRNRPP